MHIPGHTISFPHHHPQLFNLKIYRNSHRYSINQNSFQEHIYPTEISISETIYDDLYTNQSTHHTIFSPHDKIKGVARIHTCSEKHVITRYILSIDNKHSEYAMIDIPPFSKQLQCSIQEFIKKTNGTLLFILLTSKYGVYYNDNCLQNRKISFHLSQWIKLFPNLECVMYRLDIVRDYQKHISITLDGMGPWAYGKTDGTFRESGYPLTKNKWDSKTTHILSQSSQIPPDNNYGTKNEKDILIEKEKLILKSERNKEILAIHTPSKSHGSVTYLFPKRKICCSGHLFPLEYNRPFANVKVDEVPGPRLDIWGYINTMDCDSFTCRESAHFVVKKYCHKFSIILACGGEIGYNSLLSLNMKNSTKRNFLGEWKTLLNHIIERHGILYNKYEKLGIISPRLV